MFRFESAEYLYLLGIVGLFVILFIVNTISRKSKLLKFGELSLVSKLIPDASFSRKLLKFSLIILALVFMIFALARPQSGTKLQDVRSKGIELAIAIDVSNSMLAEDIKPNRLQNTRIFVQRLLSRLSNDKVALIVFAGDAFVQMPLSDDISAARMFMSTINTDIVPIQGTAIGKAIDIASRTFTSEEEISKIIIIISDGEDHEDNPVMAAKAAADNGILVHTIGMGLPGGTPIPMKNGRGFLRDNSGNVVTTALDENTLINIAKSGNGVYVRASNNANSLDAILDEIDSVKKGEIVKTKYSEYEEQFQYFLAVSIILLVINVFISEKKNKLLSKINLFKVKE